MIWLFSYSEQNAWLCLIQECDYLSEDGWVFMQNLMDKMFQSNSKKWWVLHPTWWNYRKIRLEGISKVLWPTLLSQDKTNSTCTVPGDIILIFVQWLMFHNLPGKWAYYFIKVCFKKHTIKAHFNEVVCPLISFKIQLSNSLKKGKAWGNLDMDLNKRRRGGRREGNYRGSGLYWSQQPSKARLVFLTANEVHDLV